MSDGKPPIGSWKNDAGRTSARLAMDELMEALARRDEATALDGVGRIQQWLGEVEVDLVRLARRRGVSWAEIGLKLGRSRQAVWQWYTSRGVE